MKSNEDIREGDEDGSSRDPHSAEGVTQQPEFYWMTTMREERGSRKDIAEESQGGFRRPDNSKMEA